MDAFKGDTAIEYDSNDQDRAVKVKICLVGVMPAMRGSAEGFRTVGVEHGCQ